MKRKRWYRGGGNHQLSDPRPIRSSLDQVMRGLGSPPVDKLAALYDYWPQIAGEAIASVTELGALVDGRLSVLVPDGGWASQLRWMEANLIAEIDTLVGPGVVLGFDVRVRPHQGAKNTIK